MDGLVLHAKYCFMPNRLGGCGIQGKTGELFDYAAQEQSDRGLKEILKTFEAAYPYIQFISDATGIKDPFNKKVVEAYWLGNELLEKIDKVKFYNWCFDRYKKKVSPEAIKMLVGKVPMGALPHHSFHVANAYFRTKSYQPVLEPLNKCRITAVKVTGVSGQKITGKYKKITLGLSGLEMTESKGEFLRKIKDRSFTGEIKEGDWVSVHWDWVCEKLTEKKAKNLEKYTKKQIELFNSDILPVL